MFPSLYKSLSAFLLLSHLVSAGGVINNSLSPVITTTTLKDGTEACRVWNHMGGDTMYFNHRAMCETTANEPKQDTHQVNFVTAFKVEGSGYRVMFERSDTRKWRELEEGLWTKIRPDDLAVCGYTEGEEGREEGDKRPWCVVKERPAEDYKAEKRERKRLAEEKVKAVADAGAKEEL